MENLRSRLLRQQLKRCQNPGGEPRKMRDYTLGNRMSALFHNLGVIRLNTGFSKFAPYLARAAGF